MFFEKGCLKFQGWIVWILKTPSKHTLFYKIESPKEKRRHYMLNVRVHICSLPNNIVFHYTTTGQLSQQVLQLAKKNQKFNLTNCINMLHVLSLISHWSIPKNMFDPKSSKSGEKHQCKTQMTFCTSFWPWALPSA